MSEKKAKALRQKFKEVRAFMTKKEWRAFKKCH